ncbi:unnamed protein product [Rhizophagus irregularis]|nr:unnamed protein product [Rhizophagus irregularis]
MTSVRPVYNHANIMTNVHTLNDIKDREDGSYRKPGNRLGSAYEQELEKKIRSVTEFNSEINDLSEKLDTILSLEAKVRELEGKSSDPKEIDSLKLELERVKEDLNSKNYEIECMEKGIEAIHEITSREIDALRKARLNSMEENRSLRDQISKKDNEIADLSNPPPPSINDSSQKLPGWLSDDLRPLVYKLGLKDKVIKLGKEYDKEDILEALQELLPQNEMVSRSQTDTLPNQSVHSQPTHSEKFISREGIAKQLGSAEVVPSPQVMSLADPSRTVPVVKSSLMPYAILALLLIVVIWFVVRKWWNPWKKNNTEYSPNQNYFLSSPGIFDAGLYDRKPEVRR